MAGRKLDFNTWSRVQYILSEELSEKLSGASEEEQFSIIEAYIRSEDTPEWVAGGIWAGRVLRGEIPASENLRIRLEEFIKKALTQEKNIHLIRHSYIPGALWACSDPDLNLKILVNKSKLQKVQINGKRFFFEIFQWFEAKGLELHKDYFLQKYSVEGLKRAFRISNGDLKENLQRILSGLEKKRSALERQIKAGNKALRQKLEDTLKEIDSLRGAIKHVEGMEAEELLDRVVETLKSNRTVIVNVNGKERKITPNDFTEWIIGSLVFSVPFLYEDLAELEWEAVLLGLLGEGLLKGRERATEYIKNIPFIITGVKENFEKVRKVILDERKEILEKFSENPSHLSEFLLDLLYIFQDELSENQLLEELLTDKYRFLLKSESPLKSSLMIIYKEIKEPFSSYSLQELTPVIAYAQIKTLESLSQRNYQRMVDFWEKIMEASIFSGDEFLLNISVRTLKILFYHQLKNIKEKDKKENEKERDWRLHPEILRQIWNVSKLGEKWGLNTLVTKDLGTIFARLVDFEVSKIKETSKKEKERKGKEEEEKDNYPLILQVLIFPHPETSIIKEAKNYAVSGEKLSEILGEIEKALRELKVEKYDKYILYLKEVYGCELEGIMKILNGSYWDKSFAEYLKKFLYIRGVLQKIDETNGTILESEQGFNEILQKAEQIAEKKVERLKLELERVSELRSSQRDPEISSQALASLLKEERKSLEKIDEYLNEAPFMEALFLKERIKANLQKINDLLKDLEENNEIKISERYERALFQKEGLELLPFLEKWLFSHYLLDYVAGQRQKRAQGIISKIALGIYRAVLKPYIGVSVILLPFLLLGLQPAWGKALTEVYISAIVLIVPIFFLWGLYELGRYLIAKLKKNLTFSAKLPHGIPSVQFLIPKMLALLILVVSSALLADEIWEIEMNHSYYYLLQNIVFLALAYVFVHNSIKKRTVITLKNYSPSKRATHLLSLGLMEAFIVTTFNVVMVSGVMTSRINPEYLKNSVFNIPMCLNIKLSLLKKINSLFFDILPVEAKFTPWLIISFMIKALFVGVVLQMFLEKEELID